MTLIAPIIAPTRQPATAPAVTPGAPLDSGPATCTIIKGPNGDARGMELTVPGITLYITESGAMLLEFVDQVGGSRCEIVYPYEVLPAMVRWLDPPKVPQVVEPKIGETS